MKEIKDIIGLIFTMIVLFALFPAIAQQFFDAISIGIIIGIVAAAVIFIIWLLNENNYF